MSTVSAISSPYSDRAARPSHHRAQRLDEPCLRRPAPPVAGQAPPSAPGLRERRSTASNHGRAAENGAVSTLCCPRIASSSRLPIPGATGPARAPTAGARPSTTGTRSARPAEPRTRPMASWRGPVKRLMPGPYFAQTEGTGRVDFFVDSTGSISKVESCFDAPPRAGVTLVRPRAPSGRLPGRWAAYRSSGSPPGRSARRPR